MTKIIKKAINKRRATPFIIKTVFCGVLLMVGLYVYSASIIVFSAAENEKSYKEISAQEYQNIELEKEYIELIGKLDLNHAQSIGFVNQKAKVVYVSAGHSVSVR